MSDQQTAACADSVEFERIEEDFADFIAVKVKGEIVAKVDASAMHSQLARLLGASDRVHHRDGDIAVYQSVDYPLKSPQLVLEGPVTLGQKEAFDLACVLLGFNSQRRDSDWLLRVG